MYQSSLSRARRSTSESLYRCTIACCVRQSLFGYTYVEGSSNPDLTTAASHVSRNAASRESCTPDRAASTTAFLGSALPASASFAFAG
jgi:hypothetical protein